MHFFNFEEINCIELQPILLLFTSWTLAGCTDPVRVVIMVVYSVHWRSVLIQTEDSNDTERQAPLNKKYKIKSLLCIILYFAFREWNGILCYEKKRKMGQSQRYEFLAIKKPLLTFMLFYLWFWGDNWKIILWVSSTSVWCTKCW